MIARQISLFSRNNPVPYLHRPAVASRCERAGGDSGTRTWWRQSGRLGRRRPTWRLAAGLRTCRRRRPPTTPTTSSVPTAGAGSTRQRPSDTSPAVSITSTTNRGRLGLPRAAVEPVLRLIGEHRKVGGEPYQTGHHKTEGNRAQPMHLSFEIEWFMLVDDTFGISPLNDTERLAFTDEMWSKSIS